MIGPSGSGKSTFLRCVNHLEKIDRGRLSVDGELVGYRQQKATSCTSCASRRSSASRAKIGMVFQRFNLFPHMTALENVIEAPIQRDGACRKSRGDEQGRELLPAGRASRTRSTSTPPASPAASSSGSRSRGRWPWSPKLMLFDEVTSALDPELVKEVLDVMRGAGRGGDDDDRRHPRDGLRPRRRRPGRLHGRAA